MNGVARRADGAVQGFALWDFLFDTFPALTAKVNGRKHGGMRGGLKIRHNNSFVYDTWNCAYFKSPDVG